MEAINALQQRVSAPRLGGEAPAPAVLQQIFKAALRVPDHAQLKPWRFLLVSGDARGGMAYHSLVHQGLDLAGNERIVGYVYLGEIQGRTREAPQLDTGEYFAQWPPKQ